MRPSRLWAGAIVLACLALQNFLIFADHWGGRLTFPLDFPVTYQAFPFYWQGAIRAGISPAWEPFQGAGLPFGSLMQTGLYYPPLWIYPLVGATFSLHAATLFACAHVLLGGLGAAFLARVRRLSLGWVLLAGITYQFFGGFFSNSGHPDIARGFAYVPWLVAALTPGEAEERLPWRAWVTPLWVLCFVTGSYPGQWIAGLALSGLYVGLGLLDGARPRAVLARWGLLGLGVGLTAIYLVPAFAARGELARSVEAGSIAIEALGLDHFLAAPFRYDLPGLALDPSMRSLFVPLPVVAGLFFLRRRDLAAERALVVVALLAVLLVLGKDTYRFVVRLVPPLGLSRFISADYRAWIALAVTLLGVIGLKAAFEARVRIWRVALGSVALAALLWWAQRRFQMPPEAIGSVAVVTVGVALLAMAARFWDPRIAVCLTIVLAFWDGWRFHRGWTDYWQLLLLPRDYAAWQRELVHELQHPPAARPARGTPEQTGETLDGYWRGRFVVWDYAASEHLRFYRAITATPELAARVFGAADPRVIPGGAAEPRLYAPNDVRYAVTAPADAILVENEPSSPGWSAAICDTGTPLAVEADQWPLRAWRVPAGSHDVCLHYATPGLRSGWLASLGAAVLWMALAVRRRRRPML